jgi:competence protein ComGC
MFGNMYDIEDIADDLPVGKKIFGNAALTSMCLLHARRDATMAAGRQVYKQAEMMMKMSPYQRHKGNVGSIEEFIISMPKYRYTLLEYTIPAAERTSEISYQGKALHEAIITISAIQRWKLDKGEYPATLDELIKAGYLIELPIDPYSDKSLIYKKTADNFVLYSIGRNFKDDGGKVFIEDENIHEWGTSNDEGDAVFWPVLRTWELK